MASTQRSRRRGPALIEEPMATTTQTQGVTRWEIGIFVALIALALVLRLWDLGSRALHHDESMHAFYSYELFRGKGYAHNPLLHGTFVYIANAFFYSLFGVTDATSRLFPALLGTALVALPFFLRSQLGRFGAIATAAILALSPSFLYFSRFIREDIHSAFFTLAMVVCLFRYIELRQDKYLYWTAALLALSFLTKENTYLNVAILVLFFSLVVGLEALGFIGERTYAKRGPIGPILAVTSIIWGWMALLWQLVIKGKRDLSGPASLLVILGTLMLPQLAGFAFFVAKTIGISALSNVQMAILYLVLVGLSAAVGITWNPRVWLITAGIFYATFFTFFTTFFTNPDGFASGAWGGLKYWVEQQPVMRGGQPWFYYLLLLPLYEFLPLVFALAGAVFYAFRRDFFGRFLIFWAVGGLIMYGWAGEKMPWLLLHVALPFILLGGKFLGHIFETVEWRKLRSADSLRLAGVVAIALLVFFSILGLGPRQGTELTPIEQQRLTLQTWLYPLLLLAAIGAAVYFGRGLRWQHSLRVLALVVLALLTPFSIRAATQVTYAHSDVPVEMLVYTQTSPDVTAVVKDIERIAFRTGDGQNLKVAYDSEVSWPFEWYLRDYRSRNFYGTGTPAPDAPVVLVGVDNQADARVRPGLGNKYIGQKYKLRWWFPEDYRSLDWRTVLTTPFDSQLRQKLWRYFLYRETNPLGSTDFVYYVRKDLVAGAWMPATQTAAQQQVTDEYASKMRSIPAAQAWGGLGPSQGQLNEPKGVALGPDSSIYVVEAKNNRVQKFDPNGRFVAMWGSDGSGPGQFKEPWGIAVDQKGNVYVADTWNHRIQKFDSDGRFLKEWGRQGDTRGSAQDNPGVFFGPRAIAVGSDGNLLVSDTGNKRVQRFDPEGNFLGQFGGGGGGQGQLNEPVGIALDSQGNIYIADTWNQRIQKFAPNFQPLAQWEVQGWQGESVVNKPYIAVDKEGGVYVTDPESHRVIKFASTGSLVALWGQLGNDSSSFNLPTGIAVDTEGNIFVADSFNHRLIKFQPVR